MDPYTIGWLAWGAFFCVLEGIAVATKNWDGTLSNHIRRWIGESSDKQSWSSYLRRGALLIFMGWLSGHFVFGLWG